MTLKSKTIDWGGNTLIVSNIQYATKPGQLDKATNASSNGGLGYIVEDALAVTLTAQQNGATIVFDKLDGAVITLPAPQVGLLYRFVVDTASTSVGQKIITDAASTFIQGTVGCLTAVPALTFDTANGTTHRSINWNGTTTGGLVGTWIELRCRTTTKWEVQNGLLYKSGSVATTFATS